MLRSYLWLLLCVSLWGSNFVFGSILVQEFPPLLLAAFRLLVTTLFLLGYAYSTNRLVMITKQDWKLLLLLGFIGTLLNQTAFFNGLKLTDATTAALILSLTPITTAYLASVFLGETLTKNMIVGSLIAILGVFFVIGKGSGIHLSLGVLLIFLAMITFSCSIIIVRKLTERLDSFITTVYATATGTFLLIPVAFTFEPISSGNHPLWAWLLLIATAIVMQGICALIWNNQLKKIGAGKASIFLNLQPFVAMVSGFLLLGTEITIPQLMGSLLIVVGVVMGTIQVNRMKPRRIPTAS
ncbi:DMT family transporter [Ammoniphilus sp. CFH 90114]|uniref:DMT family transporter n=1 Tax=Ammoniphilus sp. CFH 90114 TaxID=2493665 RepID=UPI00100E1BE0|nr:DMT family transporter [Ammoniphilus sp. CFH 90114]RXT15444.1 DMT family transporter [Ammoniphilus sp. CFH 90114]